MELEHTFTVPVPPEQAFAVLQDIERIGPCMPGASIDSVDGTSFTGTVRVKIGPIKVTYQGEAEYASVDEQAMTATINAKGKESRGSGTANATVTADLKAAPEGAEVHVITDLAITGRPAQFGRGVMEEVGQKLIDQFAECLADTMGEDNKSEAAVPPAAGVADSPAAPSDTTESATTPTDTTPSSPSPAPAPRTDESDPPAGDAVAPDVAAPAASVTPTPVPQRPVRAPQVEPQAIDLLGVAGAPVAKRAAPVVGVVALLLLWWWRRRN